MSADFVIKIAGSNLWIESYTDTLCGRGNVNLTAERSQAKTFETNAEAFLFWRQQSRSKPLRVDGKPNRPLTAYTVEISRT